MLASIFDIPKFENRRLRLIDEGGLSGFEARRQVMSEFLQQNQQNISASMNDESRDRLGIQMDDIRAEPDPVLQTTKMQDLTGNIVNFLNTNMK